MYFYPASYFFLFLSTYPHFFPSLPPYPSFPAASLHLASSLTLGESDMISSRRLRSTLPKLLAIWKEEEENQKRKIGIVGVGEQGMEVRKEGSVITEGGTLWKRGKGHQRVVVAVR